MRVALVNPNYTFWRSEIQYLSRLLGHQPPLGLISLASYAKKHIPCLSIRIIDAKPLGLSKEETVRMVSSFQSDVVGITITSVIAEDAEAIARLAKTALPGATIVAGGPHVSGVGANFLRGSSAFDIAVFGEGEETFREVIEARLNGRSFENIPGLMYRGRDGQVRRNAPRKLIDDLGSLPHLDWDLLPYFPQIYKPNVFFSPGGPMASLTTSRGCPFKCRFCDQSTFGRRYRATPAAYVAEAVRRLQEKYQVRYIIFCDDTFTLSRERVLEICNLLSQSRQPVRWSCDANVMTVDREMLKAMKRAGCWSISYGLESGSPQILRSVGKEIDLYQARRVISATREEGIHAKGLFIMGTPEESRETIRETCEFINSLRLSTLNLSKFTPYPGTPLSRLVRGETSSYSSLNGMNFIVPSKHLPIDRLEKEHARTLRRFYHTIPAWRVHLPILLSRWDNLRRLVGVIPWALKTALDGKALV